MLPVGSPGPPGDLRPQVTDVTVSKVDRGSVRTETTSEAGVELHVGPEVLSQMGPKLPSQIQQIVYHVIVALGVRSLDNHKHKVRL